jgi:hypothetical protein
VDHAPWFDLRRFYAVRVCGDVMRAHTDSRSQTIVSSGMDIVAGDVGNEFASFMLFNVTDRVATHMQRLLVRTAVPPEGFATPPEVAARLQTVALRDATTGAVIPQCFRADMVDNFFIARTDAVRSVLWDERLLVGEHEDFFLRARAAGLRVAYCRGDGYYILNLGTARCLYARLVDADGRDDAEARALADATRAVYQRGRQRVHADYWPIAFLKHGLVRARRVCAPLTRAGVLAHDCRRPLHGLPVAGALRRGAAAARAAARGAVAVLSGRRGAGLMAAWRIRRCRVDRKNAPMRDHLRGAARRAADVVCWQARRRALGRGSLIS